MIKDKILAKNIFWNLLGRISPLIAAIVAIPPLIGSLGIERFGVLTLVWVIIGYLSLFDLGLGRALTKLISDKIVNKEESHIPSIVWSGLFLMFIFGILGGCVAAILSPWLVHSVLKVPVILQKETQGVFYLLAFSLPIVISTIGLRGILEGYQLFGLVNAINIPMGIFSFAAPFLVLPFSKSLIPIVAILVSGRLIGWLFHLFFCYHIIPSLRHKFSLNRSMMRYLIRFGSWLTVTNIIGPFMVYLDRFMIGGFVSLASVAYYTTPYEVVTKLWIIPGAMTSVLFPAFSITFCSDVEYMTSLFIKAMKWVALILFPITIGVLTFGEDILSLWLGSEFAENSTFILQCLMVGVLINSIGQIPYTMIQSTGRPDFTAKLHILELPIYFSMMWLMLTYYGTKGAAIAWTVRVSIDTVLLLGFAKKYLALTGLRGDFHRILLIAFGSLFVMYIATLLPDLLSKGIFLFIIFLACGLTLWFLILSPQEREFAKSLPNIFK